MSGSIRQVSSANAMPVRPGQALFYMGVMVTFLAGSSVPTPLYPLYQSVWGFSSTLLTLIFAAYMFALLLMLLVTGSLSDYFGRKSVIAASIVLEALSMGLFMLAQGPAWLIVARVVQGVATGVVTSAVAAAMLDSDHQNGPTMTSVAPLFGMAIGALSAGLLVAYAPAPMHLTYAVLIVVLLLQLAWLPRMIETVSKSSERQLSLRPRVHVPARVCGTFLRLLPVCIAAWALCGFVLSLGPSLMADVFGLDNPLMGGLLVFLLAFAGGGGILALRRRLPRLALLAGGLGITIGTVLMLLAMSVGDVWLLWAGAVVSGAGLGSGFMGVIRIIAPLAAASERSALMASIYVISYLAASLSPLAAGIATQHMGLETTTYAYGMIVIMLAVLALISLVSSKQRTAVVCP